MILTVLVALALGGAAVALGLRAVAMPRIAAAARIAEMQAYGFSGRRPRRRSSPSGASSRRSPPRWGAWHRGVSSRFKEAEIRNQLMAAGLYTTAPMTFLGYRVLGTGLAFSTMLWLISAGDTSGPKAILAPLLAAAAGWVAADDARETAGRAPARAGRGGPARADRPPGRDGRGGTRSQPFAAGGRPSASTGRSATSCA